MMTQKSWAESESEFEMGSLGKEGISSPRRSDKKCRAHEHKKIEAFCENCKQLLCIQCILKQDHKSHEMVSLDVGSKREKEAFNSGM